MTYERPNIARMSGYVPGEQPDDPSVVKLNTNENPYPPAEPVMRALQNVTAEALRRYPPPTARAFRAVAARMHGLAAENVIATNGGDELLRLLITTFVDPGQPIGVTQPTYSLYPVLAAVQDAPVVETPLAEDWSLPADFADRLNEAKVKLTFVVNPHAPTGLLTEADRLAEIARRLEGLLVIDEAYVDFVDADRNYDAVRLIGELDNVVLLRTMSKGYSLAGLRFGYGLGPAEVIDPMLSRTKDSYNTDIVSQRLATAALEHAELSIRNCDAVRRERVRLAKALEGLGLPCPPSQTNFLLAGVPAAFGGGAAAVYEALKQQRIVVRYFDQDRLRDKLRITVGTPEQNDVLLAALEGIASGSLSQPRG